MDGTSFLPLVDTRRDPEPWRSDFLVSYKGEGRPVLFPEGATRQRLGDALNNTYHCVRTMNNGPVDLRNTIYCQFLDRENFVEFYDLKADPWQLNNKAKVMEPARKQKLRSRLGSLRRCRGVSCRKGTEPASIRCAATTRTGAPIPMMKLVGACIRSLKRCTCKARNCMEIKVNSKCGRTLVSRGQRALFRASMEKWILDKKCRFKEPDYAVLAEPCMLSMKQCRCGSTECFQTKRVACSKGLREQHRLGLQKLIDAKIAARCSSPKPSQNPPPAPSPSPSTTAPSETSTEL